MPFTEEDLAESAKYGTLGPAYFDARRVVEGIMGKWTPEEFKPILEKVVDQIREKLWQDVETWLLQDTESNVQGHIWRMVDDSVKAILTGEQWAIQRYAVQDGHDGERVRKAVLDHGGEAVKAGRIADLEKENVQLTESLRFYQNRGL